MTFKNSILGGVGNLIRSWIQSPNFVHGVQGWQIAKDGSAEFQDAYIRGTITGSTIIGSTIIGGTVTAGEIVSANYAPGVSGFDLNGTTGPGAGAGSNTVEINTGFRIGSASADHITLSVATGQAQMALFSGASAETLPAFVFAAPNPAIPTIGSLYLAGPTAGHGYSEIVLAPGTATEVPVIGMNTGGGPTINGITGVLNVGGSSSGDVWSAVVNNNQSVTTGAPGLIIGNEYSPQPRMFVSPSEILSVDGTGAPTTLHLNESNTETTVGGVLNKGMRHLYARDTATYTITPGTTGTFTHPTGTVAAVTFTLPASGVVTIHYKALVTAVGASGVLFGDVVIYNLTASTTPYAGSQINGWEVSSSNATFNSYAGFCTFGAGGQGGTLGAPGDTMQAVCAFQTSAATTWTITKQALTVVPSL
jgi:hypothetical protein